MVIPTIWYKDSDEPLFLIFLEFMNPLAQNGTEVDIITSEPVIITHLSITI